MAATVLASRNPKKIYYSVEGPNTRARILQAFDDGASLMSYIGHGSTTNWASEGFFKTNDIPALLPQAQQPLVLTLNCLNGFYHFPAFNSLAEALLKAEGKGAVAVFSPTGLSVNAPAQVLYKAVLREIVSGDHVRIGDALLAAQEAYAETWRNARATLHLPPLRRPGASDPLGQLPPPEPVGREARRPTRAAPRSASSSASPGRSRPTRSR